MIENEFGEVGIDDALLAKNTRVDSEDQILEVLNGCICCTVRKDLVTVMRKLAKRVADGEIQLDGIVIETTGMADPAPVAQTFFVDDDVKNFARLDGIITLVDAAHIEQHLDDEKAEGVENEAIEQAPRLATRAQRSVLRVLRHLANFALCSYSRAHTQPTVCR